MADLKMPDINSIIIAGNLTKDPTLRTTTSGTPVANFPIAYSRKFKDNSGAWREDVCYVGVVAWYKLAESCHENLSKGSAIMVEGELQSKSWQMENGYYRNIVEIKAKRIQFLNKKSGSGYLSDENKYETRVLHEESITDPMIESPPLAAAQTETNGTDHELFEKPGEPDDSDEPAGDYPKLNDITF